MKKFTLCVLLCLCLLTGCGGGKELNGEIVERTRDADGKMVSFVLRTDSGRNIGFRVTEGTLVLHWVDGVSEEDFLYGEQDGVRVTVVCDGGKKNGAYDAETVHIEEVLTRNAVTLSDGTPVDLWRGIHNASYALEDGTELLWEQLSSGPENVYVGSLESFDDLSQAAQEKVLAFYEERGLLYDVPAELERACAAYLDQGIGTRFDSRTVGQEIAPSASNERFMSFLTSVTLPIDGQMCTEVRRGDIFDRETGERMDVWDLFTCEPEAAKRKLLDLAGFDRLEDLPLRKEMLTAFEPEYIILFSEHLSVDFPAGTLPSQETSFGLSVDYADGLAEIMQDWAIPKHTE